MLRFVWFLLFFICVSAYVLFDSKALEFETKTLGSNGLIAREAAAPVFRGERLEIYFNKLVSKFSK
jgi:hypothetical protein